MTTEDLLAADTAAGAVTLDLLDSRDDQVTLGWGAEAVNILEQPPALTHAGPWAHLIRVSTTPTPAQ